MGEDDLRVLLEDRGDRDGRDIVFHRRKRLQHVAAHQEIEPAGGQHEPVVDLRPARLDRDVEAIPLIGAVDHRLVEAAMLRLGHPVCAEGDLVQRHSRCRGHRGADRRCHRCCARKSRRFHFCLPVVCHPNDREPAARRPMPLKYRPSCAIPVPWSRAMADPSRSADGQSRPCRPVDPLQRRVPAHYLVVCPAIVQHYRANRRSGTAVAITGSSTKTGGASTPPRPVRPGLP